MVVAFTAKTGSHRSYAVGKNLALSFADVIIIEAHERWRKRASIPLRMAWCSISIVDVEPLLASSFPHVR
jgi:hypothetical protein